LNLDGVMVSELVYRVRGLGFDSQFRLKFSSRNKNEIFGLMESLYQSIENV
jgi:hypothetical protein